VPGTVIRGGNSVGCIRQTLVAIGDDGKDNDALVEQMLNLDQNRNNDREQRLINAAPTVPTALYVFLVTAAVLALLSLACSLRPALSGGSRYRFLSSSQSC